MCPGERYVPAHRAAYDGDDGERVEVDGEHRAQRRLGEGRMRGDGHIRGEHDHHGAHRLREAVHGAARLAREEEPDRDHRARGGAGLHGDSQHRLEAETGARHVADVEGQAADRNQHGEGVPEPRQHPVGDHLGGGAGRDQDAPDGELGAEVDEDGGEHGEAEAGA